MTPCPTDDKLARLLDGAFSLEETDRFREHVARCSRCRERESVLRTLIADIKAAVPAHVDVRCHTRDVMDRLDRPLAERSRATLGWHWLVAAAAGLFFVVGYSGLYRQPVTDSWKARGGHTAPAIGRDVGVQPYVVEGALHPLVAGATIDATTPLTAGFRNLGESPAFLLIFAVDARSVVHWISPRYTRPEDDPVSTTLAASASERVLDSTVVLDDVGPGPLRIIALVTSTPAHVSDVESLSEGEMNASRWTSRLPGAEIRETVVKVREVAGGGR